jgi:Potassium-transporting ATPase A subunit
MADVGLELVQVLVGQGEANAILAKLREHVCQGQGRKALELVDVHEEGATLCGWRIRPAKGRKADGRYEQAAQEGRAILHQNFLSAATGIVLAVALIRGFARASMRTIGNFWVDITRCTLYILL